MFSKCSELSNIFDRSNAPSGRVTARKIGHVQEKIRNSPLGYLIVQCGESQPPSQIKSPIPISIGIDGVLLGALLAANFC